MGKKTPPFPEYPDWTTARFLSFVRSNLRKMWMKWPPRNQKKMEGRRKCVGCGRQQYEYHCEACNNWFPDKQIEIHHIEPAGSLQSLEDLTPFVRRLLVGTDKLQRVCKACHQGKTNDARQKSTSGK